MCAGRPFTIGLIVNPIAGMGGATALRGTDGSATLAEALRRGAAPLAGERARRTLAVLPGGIQLLTAAGAMGEEAARTAGLTPIVIDRPADAATSALDTRRVAARLVASGIDLLLFAGGDGTARDVAGAVGHAVPLLGIPTGAKMQSGVFATTPEAAGRLAGLLAAGSRAIRLGEAELMDIDEDRLGEGVLCGRLHGTARVPIERTYLRHAKSRMADSDAALDAACRAIAGALEPGAIHLLGPGTTMQRIKTLLGVGGTLLGVDAVRDGALLGADLSERQITRLLDSAPQPRPPRIVAGVVGGQGFVFGRGNQQIGERIIRRVGRARITIVASVAKLLRLGPPNLFVDTGSPEVDAMLAGYIRVTTGPDQTAMCRIMS